MSIATDLLLDIASEKNGYAIGEPWRFSEFSLAAVVPIIRKVDHQERGYRLLSEVKEEVKIRDTGNINKMEFTNRSGLPVLLKAGEILTGATQSRALGKSEILLPDEVLVADCVCVYSTKGIRAGQPVRVEAYSPVEIRRTVARAYSHIAGGEIPPGAPHSGLQNEVWGGVHSFSRELSARAQNLATFAATTGSEDFVPFQNLSPTYSSPSEDLAGRVREAQDKFKEVIKKVPKVENQVGLCLITLDGFDALESFNHPASWEAIRQEVLKSESAKIADVTDRDGVFEYRADKARAVIRELLGATFEENITVEKQDTSTIALESGKLIGEVVTLYGQPIHCAFMRKAS